MTATATSEHTAAADSGLTYVDPRAPRFGQAITATVLTAGVVLGEPLLIYAIAAILSAALFSGWRFDLYGFLWRTVMIPLVGKPTRREPAAPHRFAKLMGAGFTLAASALLLAGVPLVAYLLAGMVAVLAGLAASTGLCIGCRMYQQVSFFRRLGVV
ncbi:DUF4395 domain-containing protein [Haladaptatus sp. DJG-WS-42]|uniref:DUF4395 domain-containing protein n=1 Tax=Haladaptatus sp. DJG-WS-42 TaxID=3120516 RepID=UPI0030CF3477